MDDLRAASPPSTPEPGGQASMPDWRALAAAGAGLALLSLLPLPAPLPLLLLVGAVASGAIAVIVGAWRNAPADPRPWRLLLASVVLCAAAAVASIAMGSQGHGLLPPAADILLVGARLAAVLALLRLLHRGERVAGALLDAATWGLAALALAWVTVIGPTLADPSIAGSERAFALAMPVLDVVLATLALRLVADAGGRQPAGWALLAGVAALAAGDAALALRRLDPDHAAAIESALWALSAVAFGAAAMMPSMRGLGLPGTAAAERLGPWRLAALGLAAAIGPVALAIAHHGGSAAFGPALEAVAISIALLVVLRLGMIGVGMDRARREAEARGDQLVRALEAARMATWEWDAGSRRTARSAGMPALFGLPPDEPRSTVEHVYRDCIAEADRPLYDAWQTELSRAGGASEIEYRVPLPDGSVRWLRERATADLAPDGEVLAVRGVTQDVTARREAELALRQAQERQRLALDAVGVAAWEHDLVADRMLRFGDTARLLGAADDAASDDPQRFARLVVPEDRPAYDAWCERTASVPTTETIEYRVRGDAGAVRWIRETAVSLPGPSGAVELIRGVTQDVTSRHEAEAALRQAQERQRLALDAVGIAAWEYDIAANRMLRFGDMSRLYGTALDAAPGAPDHFADMIVPEDRPAFDAWRVRTATAAGTETIEYRVAGDDGALRWIRETAVSIPGPDGSMALIRGVTQDVTSLRTAERELERAEARRRLALDALGVAEWEYDLVAGTIVRSERMPLLFGMSADGPPPGHDTYTDTILPEDRPVFDAWSSRLMAAPGRDTVEYRVRTPAGEERWLRETGVSIAGEDGRVALLRGVSQEITDRKREEAERMAAAGRMEALLEHLPSIVYVIDAQDQDGTVFVSGAAERILGAPGPTSRAEWERQLHPEDRDAVLEEAGRTDATGEPFRMEYRQRAADGSWRWMRDDAVLVRDERGEPDYWLGVRTDVTDEVVSIEERRETEARYRALVEGLPAMVYLANARDLGLAEYVSPQVIDLTGYTAVEWLSDGGRFWASRLHPDDRARVHAALAEADATGGPLQAEYRIVHRNGRIVWVRDEAILLHDERGRPRAWQGLLLDITAQVAAEAELRAARDAAEEASRLKSAFLSTISHELRTPLNAILGYAALLDDGISGPLEAQQAADVRQIATSGEHLRVLIDDLLDLSRIESDRMELHPEPVDAADALETVRMQLAPLADQRGLTLTVEAEPELPPVLADPVRLRQMLVNLAGNAIKFTDAGSVALSARREDGGIALEVRDTGIGIDAEQLSRLFNPFWQADARPNRRYGGAGLGLAITRQLAELQGGTIRVESEPGAGSAFTVVLPAAGG